MARAPCQPSTEPSFQPLQAGRVDICFALVMAKSSFLDELPGRRLLLRAFSSRFERLFEVHRPGVGRRARLALGRFGPPFCCGLFLVSGSDRTGDVLSRPPFLGAQRRHPLPPRAQPLQLPFFRDKTPLLSLQKIRMLWHGPGTQLLVNKVTPRGFRPARHARAVFRGVLPW